MTGDRRYTTIDGEELYRRVALGEPVVVLDVRTEPEFAAEHIPGARLVGLRDIAQGYEHDAPLILEMLEPHDLKDVKRAQRILDKMMIDSRPPAGEWP